MPKIHCPAMRPMNMRSTRTKTRWRCSAKSSPALALTFSSRVARSSPRSIEVISCPFLAEIRASDRSQGATEHPARRGIGPARGHQRDDPLLAGAVPEVPADRRDAAAEQQTAVRREEEDLARR